jgi:3-oxoacyl-[acyl-carrier-protein] synthase II
MNSEPEIPNSQEVVVTGIGLLSALGTLSETWASLLAGKSGIKLKHLFPELPVYPLGLIAHQPIKLNYLTKELVIATLKDAGLSVPLTDCAVVIGSSRGTQADWEELATQIHHNPHVVAPIPNFLATLPSQPAIATARYLQTTAPVFAPMAACATGLWAIARGYELIQTGQCQRAIVGAVEAPITRLTLAAFERMGALAKTGCYPFDKQREGLVLGEGGAMLLLETAELAARRNVSIYGKILGFGLTCDAHQISAPQTKNGRGAIAIKQCLERSNLNAKAIDYIQAHGTSTTLNDRHEAQLIKYLFPQGVAVSSTKGATGHTLGASGAISVALTFMAFQRGYLPPCVGLNESEFDLDLVTKSRQGNFNYALCLNFGFGGQNTVLALARN